MLLAGADPNTTTDVLGRAPALCVFAHEGSAEMVALLLEFGADVEASNSQGCTPLALAAIRGHIDVVRLLVGAGASLGHTDTAGQCPLVHAARNGRMNVAGFLLNCDWVVSGPGDISLAEAVQQGLVAASAQGHIEVSNRSVVLLRSYLGTAVNFCAFAAGGVPTRHCECASRCHGYAHRRNGFDCSVDEWLP